MNDSGSESKYLVEGRPAAEQGRISNRQGALGFMALMSLALPALLIRYLFPNLDPLVLAGLGIVAYSTYLGLLLIAVSRQSEEGQPSLQPISAEAYEATSGRK